MYVVCANRGVLYRYSPIGGLLTIKEVNNMAIPFMAGSAGMKMLRMLYSGKAKLGKGTKMAADRDLILVDTKYEFGKYKGKIYLIDEIHTPDSSRYFIKGGFEDCLRDGLEPKQLSKEFVRKWLLENGFNGGSGQIVPDMDDYRVNLISERYIELYELITGEKFIKSDYSDNMVDIINLELSKIL